VSEFTDREVRPVARELEHTDTYPEKLIGQMKEMGIFGISILLAEHGPGFCGVAGHAQARLEGRRDTAGPVRRSNGTVRDDHCG